MHDQGGHRLTPAFSPRRSRFEKHCGSKAKKWRTSLRVEPGSCPEVRAGDPPMPVGQYLSLKGVGFKVSHPGPLL